jgi:hypothetical protein
LSRQARSSTLPTTSTPGPATRSITVQASPGIEQHFDDLLPDRTQ